MVAPSTATAAGNQPHQQTRPEMGESLLYIKNCITISWIKSSSKLSTLTIVDFIDEHEDRSVVGDGSPTPRFRLYVPVPLPPPSRFPPRFCPLFVIVRQTFLSHKLCLLFVKNRFMFLFPNAFQFGTFNY